MTTPEERAVYQVLDLMRDIQAERDRYRDALRQILNVIGPGSEPVCAESFRAYCAADICKVLHLAQKALEGK